MLKGAVDEGVGMKRPFRRWLLLTAVGLLLAACFTLVLLTLAVRQKPGRVCGSAAKANAFEELANSFKAENPGVNVVLDFAGSQQLAQQLGWAPR